jgi:hypothetical protein
MSRCRNCNEPITFRPHPQNPEKLAPFDRDGEIHFARCKSKKPKKDIPTLDSWMCKGCEGLAFLVFWQQTASGDRLAVLCENLHHSWIPITETTRTFVNATKRQAEIVQELRAIRYIDPRFYPAEIVRRRHNDARNLVDEYQQFFGTPTELRSLFRMFGGQHQ